MRQWMVPPQILCKKHLLGEHVEHHMFVGSINKGIGIKGYINNNLLEPKSLYYRHSLLVSEMIARGYNHKSRLPKVVMENVEPYEDHLINEQDAKEELLNRCPECKKRNDIYIKLKNQMNEYFTFEIKEDKIIIFDKLHKIIKEVNL